MSAARTLHCELSDDAAGRPGLLWRVGHMLAQQAINIDEFAVHHRDGRAVMVICFAASDRQLKQVVRRIARYDGVEQVSQRQATRLSVSYL